MARNLPRVCATLGCTEVHSVIPSSEKVLRGGGFGARNSGLYRDSKFNVDTPSGGFRCVRTYEVVVTEYDTAANGCDHVLLASSVTTFLPW